MPSLRTITQYLDEHLKIKTINDWSSALNGLQVENNGTFTKIGAAVDACEAVISEAVERKIDLLLVHHGLFWAGTQPVTGALHRKLRLALDNNLAIYSSHLPLDLHPILGNNALLCKALGFKKLEPFFFEKGQFIGFQSAVSISRNDLHARLSKVLGGPVHLAPGGPDKIKRVGVVTGGSGGEVARAAAEGVDTFITGEGPHHSYTLAEELGINLFYGGHYATETQGIKALAAHLSKRYRTKWEFIDHPTGL